MPRKRRTVISKLATDEIKLTVSNQFNVVLQSSGGGGGGGSSWPATTQSYLSIVPDRIGYGTNQVGGSGRAATNKSGTGNHGVAPQIYHVTNTNATGAGSLRGMPTTGGPLTVVFDVSGVIDWSTVTGAWDWIVTRSNVTILGSTAPGPGIAIIGGAFYFQGAASNWFIEGLAIRHGDKQSSQTAQFNGNRASVKMQGTTGTIQNIVFYHCSFSWGTDEMLDIFTGNTNIDFIDCIMSMGLFESDIYTSEASGFGLLATNNGTTPATISNIGCLYVHMNERCPSIYRSDSVLVNNIIYDACKGHMRWEVNDPSVSGHPFMASAVGNLVIEGPSWTLNPARPGGAFSGHVDGNYILMDNGSNSAPFAAGSKFYFADNALMTGPNSNTNTVAPLTNQWSPVQWQGTPNEGGLRWDNGPPASVGITNPLTAGLVAASVTSVKSLVLNNVGPHPKVRDFHDTTCVNDVLNRTGRLWNTVAQYGGYPNYGTTQTIDHTTTAPVISGGTAIPDGAGGRPAPDTIITSGTYTGYTNLEKWGFDWIFSKFNP